MEEIKEKNRKNVSIGRPSMKQPRDKKIQIRLTQEEQISLKSKAKKHGVTLSKYLILSSIDEKETPVFLQKLPKETEDVFRELRKMAGSVHYLSHKVSGDILFSKEAKTIFENLSKSIHVASLFVQENIEKASNIEETRRLIIELKMQLDLTKADNKADKTIRNLIKRLEILVTEKEIYYQFEQL